MGFDTHNPGPVDDAHVEPDRRAHDTAYTDRVANRVPNGVPDAKPSHTGANQIADADECSNVVSESAPDTGPNGVANPGQDT